MMGSGAEDLRKAELLGDNSIGMDLDMVYEGLA